LPYDPAVSLLGIYPKESMSAYNRDTCIYMFIEALFTKPSYEIMPINGWIGTENLT
jgi:hypothetical protein